MIPVNNSGYCSRDHNVDFKTLHVPCNKNNPVSILSMDNGERLAFLWPFPFGKFGYNHERPQRLHPSMYFRLRLYDKAALFRKDLAYLLHSAISYDIALMKSEVNIHVKMRKSVKTSENKDLHVSVTAGDIKNVERLT